MSEKTEKGREKVTGMLLTPMNASRELAKEPLSRGGCCCTQLGTTSADLHSCTTHTPAPSPTLPCRAQGHKSDSGMTQIETTECPEQGSSLGQQYMGSNPSSAPH